MSTRSCIGIQDKSGKITFIYCHGDGYPAYNGKMLLNHYNTIEKIKELLSYGNASCIGSVIGEKHSFEDRGERDECTFYSRDRDDDICIMEADTEDNFCKDSDGMNAEYVYLFRKNAWYWAPFDSKEERKFKKFKKLTPKVCEG